MSEQKRYTAQEMREAAIDLDWKNPSPFRKLKEHRMYVNMLRYAADVVERCEIVTAEADKIRSMPKAPLDGSCHNQNVNAEMVLAKIAFFDTVSATLLGDVGKEEE